MSRMEAINGMEELRAQNIEYVKRVAELVDALERQLENMSFILNRVQLHQWHGKFESEMLKDWELLKL
jgi:hypothetical protein